MTIDNPYVGPRTFQEKDKDLFFGREKEAKGLLASVITERLLLFYAPSGAGKSSLINTRLIPDLNKENFTVLPVGRVGGELPEGINEVNNIFIFNLLLRLDGGQVKTGQIWEDMEQGLQRAKQLTRTTLSAFLQEHKSKLDIMEDDNQETPRVLIIDQFEEIVTSHLDRWQQREEFFGQLKQAMVDDLLLWIVLAMREDYIATLDPYAQLLPRKLRARFRMERLNHEAALEAIELPAARGERTFAPGVAQILVDNLSQIRTHERDQSRQGEFVEPVLLQVVCYQLWEDLKTRSVGEITLQDLPELGNVDKALADFYEQNLREAVSHTNVSEIQLRNWFKDKLITKAGTRGNVFKDKTETEGLPNATVDFLENNHLLHAEIRAGGTWYELVHDRLIEPILQSNQAWLQTNPLILAAQTWKDSGENKDTLYRGHQLEDALSILPNRQTLGPLVEEFLRISEEVEQTQQAEEARRQHELKYAQALAQVERQRAEDQIRMTRRFRWLAITLAIVSLLAMAAFVFATREREEKQRQAQEAERQAVLAIAAKTTAEAEANARATAQIQAEIGEKAAETAQAEAVSAKQTAEIGRMIAETAQAEAVSAQQTAQARQRQVEVAQTEAASAKEVASISQEEAAKQTALANSRQLALAAVDNLKVDPELSILLAIQALSVIYTSEAENALHEALRFSRIQHIFNHDSEIFKVAFSPDGKYLATAGKAGKAIIWDVSSGEKLQTLSNHTGEIFSTAFDPVKTRLATGSRDKTVIIWNYISGQPLITLTGHLNAVAGVAFSPNGAYLATASWDGTVKIWDTDRGNEIRTLPGHMEEVSTIAFSADGVFLASGSVDKTVKIWKVDTGEELKTLAGNTSPINSVAFNPIDSNFLAVASIDSKTKIWNVNSGQEFFSFSGHTSAVSSLVYSWDGNRLATGGADGKAKIWAAASGQELMTLSGHKASILGVAFSPDDTRLATASADGTARVWNISLDQELNTLVDDHPSVNHSVTFSPDDKYLAIASADETAKIWDITSGQILRTLQSDGTGRIFDVSFSPDGKQLATASGDGKVRLWIIAEPHQKPRVLSGHNGVVLGVTFGKGHNRRLLATASADHTAKIWDVNSGVELQTFSGHSGKVVALDFSPDGMQLGTASEDGTAKVWDIVSGQELLTLSGHKGQVSDITFGPDGQKLATTSFDKTVKIWSLPTGQELFTLPSNTNEVYSVAFSSDGTRLASVSGDTTKVWDATSGQELLTLSGHTDRILSVAFNSNGKHLVTTGEDGTVRLYTLDIEELIALARSRVTRVLTIQECQKYLKQETCPTTP